MDAQTLKRAMEGNLPLSRYEELLPHFEEAMRLANINTVRRAAMWCAQIGHESGGLQWLREIWGPTAAQLTYDNHPSLGNRPGEGKKFMGRGVIQVTGRANYTTFSRWAHGKGLVSSPTYFADHPEALEQPRWAFVSAVWYWISARTQLNEAADKGDVAWATRLIQGGSGHLAQRQARYARCLAIGEALLPSGKGSVSSVADKVLSYPRDQVTQDTYYNCGPASTQTVVRSKTGILVSESKLGSELGTHTGGTNWIGQFPKVLNKYMPGADYRIVEIPNTTATAAQIEALWSNLVRSVDNGYGVVANIVSPPSNRPRVVLPSTIPFRYSGGTVYHYVAVMGYGGSGAGRRVWIADSGFYPYGGWISLENLAHLIAGKGYAASFAPVKAVTKPVTSAPVESKPEAAVVQPLDRLKVLFEQIVGPQLDKNGHPTYKGWDIQSIHDNAKAKGFKDMTAVEMAAVQLFRLGDIAAAVAAQSQAASEMAKAIKSLDERIARLESKK